MSNGGDEDGAMSRWRARLTLMALALAGCGARSAIPDGSGAGGGSIGGICPVGFWQGEGNTLDSEGDDDGHWGLLNGATPGSYAPQERSGKRSR
jgi:hypothetical protein